MATGHDQRVLRQIGTLLAVGTAGELTDGQLLERFATRTGDAAEQAFAAWSNAMGRWFSAFAAVCSSTRTMWRRVSGNLPGVWCRRPVHSGSAIRWAPGCIKWP